MTRYDPERPYQLQMVAIQRRDTKEWAIPGGMVDAGESVSVTLRREFTEEAGAIDDPEKKAAVCHRPSNRRPCRCSARPAVSWSPIRCLVEQLSSPTMRSATPVEPSLLISPWPPF